VLCVGQFVIGLWELVCAVFGTVSCGIEGVSVCCVWDSFVWVCGERVFAVCGTVWSGFGGVSVCCVWDSLLFVCGRECVLCVGQFGVGLWE